MVSKILLVLIFCLAPAFVLWLCKKVPFFGKIGPILILYILGVIIGNLPWINDGNYPLKETLTNALIPMALPMMLFACALTRNSLKGIFRSLIAGLIAIVVSIFVGYWLFGRHVGTQAPEIAALITGCETGGTINMASLQMLLGVPSETFVMLNSYDMLVCFLYFVFLLSVGIRLFRKFLKIAPKDDKAALTEAQIEVNEQIIESHKNPYSILKTAKGWGQVWRILLAVIICVGLSFGLTKLFPKGWFMPIFILGISTFALIAANTKPVKKLTFSYDLGLYLIYIFSITIASMADVTKLNIREGLYAFLFLFFVIFVSLLLQVILSKLLKVDADMMIATSVALINSPPFVPIVVSAMENKKVLVPGITVGIIGFALGNYLGFFIYNLLI
ncbi:MAG: DUF819 family protein [Bacteroidales bacterium]|nr:DUF819 family protein [Bacteroidales bacterium]